MRCFFRSVDPACPQPAEPKRRSRLNHASRIGVEELQPLSAAGKDPARVHERNSRIRCYGISGPMNDAQSRPREISMSKNDEKLGPKPSPAALAVARALAFYTRAWIIRQISLDR